MITSFFSNLRPEMLDVLGPLIDFKLSSSLEAEFSVLRAIMPAGTLVPVHSHADLEVIVVLEGRINIWLGGSWHAVEPGGAVEIPPHARHSLLNEEDTDAAVILVTTSAMRKFLQSVGIPASNPPGAQDSKRVDDFINCALELGHWLGTPEDQAALGSPLKTKS